jgi:hypothetical protein
MQMLRLLSSCPVLRPPITSRLTSQIASTAGDATVHHLIHVVSKHKTDNGGKSANNMSILIWVSKHKQLNIVPPFASFRTNNPNAVI